MSKKALFSLLAMGLPLIGAEVVGVYTPATASKGYRNPSAVSTSTPRRRYVTYKKNREWKVNFYFFLLKEDYREYEGSGTAVKLIDRDYSNWGEMKGFGIRGTWNNFIYGKFEYAYGDTHYVGATWGGEPLENDQTGTWVLNIEGGVQIPSTGFLVGVGYRTWNRGNSGKPGDYDEVYYWPYLQLGYKVDIPIPGVGEFNPELSYQYAISPKMKAYLGSTPTFDLGTVTGYRIELPLTIQLQNNLQFLVFYRYQYWDISGSGPTPATINGKEYTLYEPASKTNNHYVGIGVRASF